MANKKKPLKKQKIRNSEYYDMQFVLDELYAASVKGQRFCNLVELIKRPENIKLAYRNKIGVDDTSVLNDSTENIITLVTCVKNQPDYRWCVQAKAS